MVFPTMNLCRCYYEGLRPYERYLLDPLSNGMLKSKYKDNYLELIEMVTKNNLHKVAKPFIKGVPPTQG